MTFQVESVSFMNSIQIQWHRPDKIATILIHEHLDCILWSIIGKFQHLDVLPSTYKTTPILLIPIRRINPWISIFTQQLNAHGPVCPWWVSPLYNIEVVRRYGSCADCMSTNDNSHWSKDSLRPAWGSDWAWCGFHAVCAALSWWDDFGFARQCKLSKELDVQSYYLLFCLEILKIPWILVYTEVPSSEIMNLWTRILAIHKLNRAEKPTFSFDWLRRNSPRYERMDCAHESPDDTELMSLMIGSTGCSWILVTILIRCMQDEVDIKMDSLNIVSCLNLN